MKQEERPVLIEQEYDSSAWKVWNSITIAEEMRKWFFAGIKDFQPVLGFRTEFTVETPNRAFVHVWEVKEVVSERKIAYTWKYRGVPGDSIVSFEITPRDRGALLQLCHQVTEDFPDNIPEFKRESCEEGWNYFLIYSLKRYLDPESV